MPSSADSMRRWLGLLFLALAFGMLMWGRIVLWDRLGHIAFIVYWTVCFVLTFAAIITALFDVRATRKRARREHQELIQRTLEEIEREAHDKSE